MSLNVRKTSFDPETSFFDLTIVKLTASIFFGVAICSYGLITWHSGLWLQFDFSYKGFNFWIECYRFPLAVLAMLIPIGAVFAANHRSEQTKKQIEETKRQVEETRKQNVFSNYYKHLEEFQKYSDKSLNRLSQKDSHKHLSSDLMSLDTRHIHKLLFNEIENTGFIKIKSEFLNDLNAVCIPSQDIEALRKGTLEKKKCCLLQMFDGFRDILKQESLVFSRLLHLGYEEKLKTLAHYEKEQLSKVKSDQKHIISSIVNAYQIVDILYRFEMALEVIGEIIKFDSNQKHFQAFTTYRVSKEITDRPYKEKGIPSTSMNFLSVYDFVDTHDTQEKRQLYMNRAIHPISHELFVEYVNARLANLIEVGTRINNNLESF